MKGTLYDYDTKEQKLYTPIQQFYIGKCVFLTGATGFFGKVLLEKLLRSCAGIDTIYILLRSKKGKSTECRLKELLASPMFSKLSEPSKDKIKYIDGEMGIPNLGISPENRVLLINQVNVVFHCAATVRFDEKLKAAMKINVIGTSDLVTLCKEISNLQAFIHVSTAYSNCHEDTFIREEFYSPGLTCEDVRNLENVDDFVLDVLSPRIIKTWPNTYTFTKAIGEDIIKNDAANLPVAVFRPGIVMSTSGLCSIPGFVDNIYGPIGIIIGVGKGILRVINTNGEFHSHMIPADFCINTMIAASWDIATNKYPIPPIYNYVPEPEDNISWNAATNLWAESGLHFPADNCFWWPTLILVKNKLMFSISLIFLHFIPGILVDTVLKIVGKKPILFKIYIKINKIMEMLTFFGLKKFTFELNNIKTLRSCMSPEDLQIFYNNTKNFDWMNYSLSQVHGVKVFLLKENLSNLICSRKRVQRLRYVHYFMKGIFIFILFYFVINTLQRIIF